MSPVLSLHSSAKKHLDALIETSPRLETLIAQARKGKSIEVIPKDGTNRAADAVETIHKAFKYLNVPHTFSYTET